MRSIASVLTLPAGSRRESGSVRVVVVDDSPQFRQLLRFILARDKRFEVVGEAADGVEAVDKAREQQPDLMLLDVRMPRMDGFAAVSLIREASPRTRVVIVSGTDPDRGIERARERGIEFVEKLVHPREFQAKLLALAGPAQ